MHIPILLENDLIGDLPEVGDAPQVRAPRKEKPRLHFAFRIGLEEANRVLHGGVVVHTIWGLRFFFFLTRG